MFINQLNPEFKLGDLVDLKGNQHLPADECEYGTVSFYQVHPEGRIDYGIIWGSGAKNVQPAIALYLVESVTDDAAIES